MKIGQLARTSGLSAHTIRYYERIGLLHSANRDSSGRRDYDDSSLIWIEFIRRLKSTGMPIREMLRYAKLRDGGSDTEQERHDILVQHRRKARARLIDLQACLGVLDTKIANYGAALKKDNNDEHNR